MGIKLRTKHDRHTVSLLSDHMVFCTKYRRKVLVGDIKRDCKFFIRQICRDLDVKIINLSVGDDHVHIFFQYSPKQSLSQIAHRIKGASARKLRLKHPSLKEWNRKSLWSPSCFHGSVGHGVDIVDNYIKNQR